MDAMSSFIQFFLGTWLVPKGYIYWSYGNLTSCDIQGFFGALCLFGTPIYNCSLALFYKLNFKNGWDESKIKAFEKWLHLAPWTVGLSLATSGLVMNAYTGGNIGCWYEELNFSY